MNYKHLTTFERSKIEVLNKLGYSTRKIAKEINRHHSTVDRGKEFACYKNIEKDLKISVYFADPYSSCQRGSNKN